MGGMIMRFSRIVLVIYLFLFALVASLPPATWGQVRPDLDQTVPAYAYQDSASGTLIVSTSDTMRPLVKLWADGLIGRHPSLKATILGDQSGTGLAPLLEHRTEMAALSRRMTAAEISEFVKEYGYEPTEVPVAIDALAIFVHKDNPIAGLSLDQLDAMFCRERRRGILHAIDAWGLVGLVDEEWFETPVQLYGRNGKFGTGAFFREDICKGGTFTPQLNDVDGSASVVLELESDPHGIGFSSIGYRTSMVKPLPIAAVKGGRYVEPSFQTAMDGTYPLRRNLYLYVAKPPKSSLPPALTELIRFALSAQGQELARDLGYLPLASTELRRLASKWSPSVKSARTEKQSPIESPSGS